MFSFVSDIGVDEGLELVAWRDLSLFLEAVGHPEIFIDILDVYGPSVLVVHDQPSDHVLCERFGNESVPVGCGEYAFAGLLLALLLLLVYLLCYLLQVLQFNKLVPFVRPVAVCDPSLRMSLPC